MCTEKRDDAQPPLPRHFYVGLTCGVLSLITLLFAIAYFVVVSLGFFAEPPRGLSPIWGTVIALLAMVPIGMSCAHLAAKPLHRRMTASDARRTEEMAEVREEMREMREALYALTDALSAREEPAPSGLTPEVIELGERITQKINGGFGVRPAR